MKNLSAFNFITLNGYLNGPDGDISWHKHGIEENQYAAESLKSGNILLFGRKTYEMMANYWPTPMAMKNDPMVAEGMNNAEKIVFSRTLKKANWKNTKIISDNVVLEIMRLKKLSGSNLTLLGSGSILTLFAENGLIDDYQIMIDPVAISSGTPIFNEIKKPLNLKLTNVKTFMSGVVLLSYKP
ncbi:MAG: dihydrofolate reductase [Bacteroidetes bacterium GWA2_31_9b]|nr:MAG: dihydrofolate reductase [Bacteroidetes bacterium GWA2_31_9b]